MLAPDHDTVTCASDVIERARQHHAWRRQAFAQPRRRAALKVVEPEPKPEPAPAPVHEPEEWPEPGESFALWWVQVKDRPGYDLDQLFPVWLRLKDEQHDRQAILFGAQPVPPPAPRFRIASIIQICAKAYRLTPKDIICDARSKDLIEPRQVAVYLTREMTTHSWSEIGRKFHRDHSTAIHSHQKIRAAIPTNPDLADRVKALRLEIEKLAPPPSNFVDSWRKLSTAAAGLFPDESDPVKNEMADAVLATPAGRDQEPMMEVSR
jgi:hypothetical protein